MRVTPWQLAAGTGAVALSGLDTVSSDALYFLLLLMRPRLHASKCMAATLPRCSLARARDRLGRRERSAQLNS